MILFLFLVGGEGAGLQVGCGIVASRENGVSETKKKKSGNERFEFPFRKPKAGKTARGSFWFQKECAFCEGLKKG